MLTTKSRYAVMAMVDMAVQEHMHEKPKAISLSEIAERQDITVAYLEQIFSCLKANNLVKSQRGPGGGYLIAKDYDEIHISDIIKAVAEPIKMVRCNHNPDKGCMSDKARCLTHDLWDGLTKQIENYLGSITIQDIIEKNAKKKELFNFMKDSGQESRPTIN
jgi:Rrf2 family iron-sulfur cluster assembly transcriptional regulator